MEVEFQMKYIFNSMDEDFATFLRLVRISFIVWVEQINVLSAQYSFVLPFSFSPFLFVML